MRAMCVRSSSSARCAPQVLVTLDERMNLRLHDALSLNELQAISVKSYSIVSQAGRTAPPAQQAIGVSAWGIA